MDERKLMEQLKTSADSVKIPECLKPEQIKKKLESQSAGQAGKRKAVRRQLAAAACVILCVGCLVWAAVGTGQEGSGSSSQASAAGAGQVESAADNADGDESFSGASMEAAQESAGSAPQGEAQEQYVDSVAGGGYVYQVMVTEGEESWRYRITAAEETTGRQTDELYLEFAPGAKATLDPEGAVFTDGNERELAKIRFDAGKISEESAEQ